MTGNEYDDKTVSKMADDVMTLCDANNEMVLALKAQLKGFGIPLTTS